METLVFTYACGSLTHLTTARSFVLETALYTLSSKEQTR